jgi:NADH-quinone oxidoreductase subunit M
MVVLLIFLVPLISGLLAFFLKNDRSVRGWALISSIVTLVITHCCDKYTNRPTAGIFTPWMGTLGSTFSLKLDGLSQLLVLLTAIAFPVIFISPGKVNTGSHTIFLA